MSKTSGVSAEILTLPKGGGALRGLGSTFEADLNTGTGGYSIPIDVPAGPNGVQPRIAVRYHSGAGAGPFGLGWSLGQVAIARTTEGRIPSYGPDDDRFTLLGVDELLPIGGGLYRPRVDTLHWRIRRLDDGWELTDTDGTRYLLGTSSGARVETAAAGLTKTAAWLLEELRDPNGNAVRYSYLADGAQRYLERVEWGTYRLAWQYEPRPDPFSSARQGFLLETSLRCRRVELHVTGLAPSLTRSWALAYEQAPGNGASLLSQVTLRGHGPDGAEAAAPPLTMEYSAFQPTTLERFTPAEPGINPGSFGSRRIELVDWDGDGLPDLLELGGGQARVWPNRGRARWDAPRSLATLPTPIALDQPGVAFADMNSDGAADLIMLDRPLAGYYPLRPGGGFEQPVFWRQAPSARLADRRARLIDLDGDGVTDLLVATATGFQLHYRDEALGWAAPQVLPRPAAPPLAFDDPHVHVADMNGDGLHDLVRVDGAGVVYYPYLGNGRWDAPVTLEHPPELPRPFDPSRMALVDVDGDGCADLVYVAFDRVLYWINQGGRRLGDQREVAFTPPAMPGEYRLADMKGGGGVGIVWGSAGVARRGFLYLDFSGGGKPYLLSALDNGLGLRTEIDYRPSTEYALDDADAGRPWRTFHPFPVQCVAEIRLLDSVTGQVSATRHHYHDARYDPDARAFLGFGVVDADSIGDGAIPTLRTRNSYHLGLDPADPTRPLSGDERLRLAALRRRVLRTEYFAPDGSELQGRPFLVVHHEYDARLDPALDGRRVLVPFETRTLEEQFEREPEPFAFREIRYEQLDSHGNILRQRVRAWRAGHEAAPDQDVITEASFAANPAEHIVSLPARVTQRDADGTILAASVTHYDGPPHVGLPEGQATTGNVTLQQTLVLTDALAAAVYGAAPPDFAALGYARRPGEAGWWATDVSYERQGAALLVRGPRGFETRLAYEATGQFPASLTDAAGNTVLGAADEHVFQMASYTDANGHTTRDRFDPLGRVVATLRPGDSEALPGVAYGYRTAALPVRSEMYQRERQDAADALEEYQYFTGRGELLQRIVRGEGDAGREYIVGEMRAYTTRGQVCERLTPFYTASAEFTAAHAGQLRLAMRFDALGRLVEQLRPDGGRVTQVFARDTISLRDVADNAGLADTTLVHTLDSLKRVLTVERCLPDRTLVQRYAYDAAGRVLRVAHSDGGETSYAYDLAGRVLRERATDTGETLFVHDAAGNQVERSTAAGRRVQCRFDALERLVSVTQDGAAAPEIRYSYVDSGDAPPPDGVRNRVGRVWQITDRVGTLTYAYDDQGRAVQTSRTVDAVAEIAGRAFTTDVAYDALGRVTRLTLPEPAPLAGRRVVQYRYNRRGLLQSSPGFVGAAEYDVHGHLTALRYASGVETLLDYDPLSGRPARTRVLGPGGVLRDQRFSFGVAGNLERIDSPLLLEAAEFSYDALDQLLSARYGNGDEFSYSYGDGGKIASAPGLGALSYAPGSGAVTEAGGQPYSYAADGHLTGAPYGTLRFDGLDNLVHVDLADGRSADYLYDFSGRRVVRQLSDGAASLAIDEHLEFQNGAPVLWVTFGGKRIMVLAGGGAAFLHHDLHGTPTLYTDTAGAELRRVAFGPYGTLRADSGAAGAASGPTGINDQALDNETGLICLGRRYYDPRLGRFISPDRAVAGLLRLDAFDRYQYCHNNPLRYTDPQGMFSWGDFFAILGVAIVVAALVVAGFFCGGATWAVAGAVVISVKGLLIGTAIGIAAGAALGGIAAGVAGGDIWAGVLLGGFLGGVAGFSGGILGAAAGGLAGSLFSGSVASYVAAGVGGMVQGAFVGAATGFATGFAGGKGTAESMWTHLWKGAVIGAITGLLMGLASAYVNSFNTDSGQATLRIGVDKIDPRVPANGGTMARIDYVDTSVNVGASIARNATGVGPGSGIGTFVSVGTGPGAASLVNIPIGWIPSAIQYGGLTLSTATFVGLDKYNILEFGSVLVLLLEALPYGVGLFFTLADDTNWGWFEDMNTGLQNGLSMPAP